jgi:propane monooxygenase coupling protein
MEAKPGVSVAYLQSMIRLDAERRLEFDFDELTEAIGEAFDQSAFEEIMSTHCGRMVALDDRMVLFADPEEAADYLGFDLTPVSSERLRVRPARPPDKGG